MWQTLHLITKGASEKAFKEWLQRAGAAGINTVKAALKEGSAEALQEMMAQVAQVAQNLSVRDIYDATRQLDEGVADSGEIGFVLGVLMGGISNHFSKPDISQADHAMLTDAQEKLARRAVAAAALSTKGIQGIRLADPAVVARTQQSPRAVSTLFQSTPYEVVTFGVPEDQKAATWQLAQEAWQTMAGSLDLNALKKDWLYGWRPESAVEQKAAQLEQPALSESHEAAIPDQKATEAQGPMEETQAQLADEKGMEEEPNNTPAESESEVDQEASQESSAIEEYYEKAGLSNKMSTSARIGEEATPESVRQGTVMISSPHPDVRERVEYIFSQFREHGFILHVIQSLNRGVQLDIREIVEKTDRGWEVTRKEKILFYKENMRLLDLEHEYLHLLQLKKIEAEFGHHIVMERGRVVGGFEAKLKEANHMRQNLFTQQENLILEIHVRTQEIQNLIRNHAGQHIIDEHINGLAALYRIYKQRSKHNIQKITGWLSSFNSEFENTIANLPMESREALFNEVERLRIHKSDLGI